MQDRAYEAAVKSNGHNAQLAVEDYGVQNNGQYPPMETSNGDIIANLSGGVAFSNPFGGQFGFLVATETADDFDINVIGPEGTVVYYPPSYPSPIYTIACYGEDGELIMTLSNGEEFNDKNY